MQRTNLAAHTDPGCSYPAYMSINRLPDGAVEITVRSPASPDGKCGDTAAMAMTCDIARATLTQALESLNR